MTLKAFITDRKTGKTKRGALARVAEHLGCQKNTVKKWARGEWSPGSETARRIQDMIHQKISLAPKKNPGRKPHTRNGLQTKSRV